MKRALLGSNAVMIVTCMTIMHPLEPEDVAMENILVAQEPGCGHQYLMCFHQHQGSMWCDDDFISPLLWYFGLNHHFSSWLKIFNTAELVVCSRSWWNAFLLHHSCSRSYLDYSMNIEYLPDNIPNLQLWSQTYNHSSPQENY